MALLAGLTAGLIWAPLGAFHVATSGNDANAGTLAAPWRTLQKAADSVPAGATVVVHAGTYHGFTMSRSGSAGQPIVFQGAAFEARPVIDGTLGSRLNVVRFGGVHDIVFKGFVVQNAGGDSEFGSGIRTDTSAHDIVIEDNVIRENHGWGVNVHTSHDVTVRDNDISGNAMGIQVSYAGEGTLLLDNLIHDNDRMLRNTPTSVNAHDDAGGMGIGFVKSTGHVIARGNSIWGNRAASYDYGQDGAAFEVYGASNVTMTDNVMWDNQVILESGTDNNVACRDNVFARNTAYGASTGGQQSWGMWLRCGANMLVANNTFVDLHGVLFVIGADSPNFSGSIDELRILNNIASMGGSGAKIFHLINSVPALQIDHNLAWTTGAYGSMPDGRSTTSAATFASWTGYQVHAVTGDAGFMNSARRDYRLSATSPAIDSGMVLAGIADAWHGVAPDMGRFERTAVTTQRQNN